VTPAGRERYLKILFKYLNKQKNDFFEWHLWLNTKNLDDINFMNDLSIKNKWIKIIKKNIPSNLIGTNKGINYFFDYVNQSNTIYIRLDDDIVYLENNFIKNLSEFRKKNKEYPFIFANIINNNVIDHYHYLNNSYNFKTPIDNDCIGNLWSSKTLPIEIHNQFQEDIKNNNIIKFKLDNIVLNNFNRVSINAISWIGGYINFNNISGDEEQFISCVIPYYSNKPNIIYGDAICVHAGFFSTKNRIIRNYYSKI
jgi:hypothetical protein